jgi:hypothetical protein
MNKVVKGTQLTVAWHVDDLKVLHVKSSVVDQFISDMEEEFGKETPLNKSRGKVHHDLGMTLNFSKPGEVTVSMIDYIKGILHDAPKEMRGSAATPAANHLFQVNTVDPVPLKQDKADINAAPLPESTCSSGHSHCCVPLMQATYTSQSR